MTTMIEHLVPQQLVHANLVPRTRAFPSPATWRDQILYFLLPDRFSDGNEDARALFDRHNPAAFRAPDKAAWMAAGTRFQGGTIRGIASKLDYLQGLGVTALWVGALWRQRPDLQTYHGYGIQNFLDIDPRFGTRQDLRDLVDAAHDRGLYVLLDVIYNHTGNNWFYRADGGAPAESLPYNPGGYALHGWRSASGTSIGVPASLDDGVWPQDFQNPDWYTRAGAIRDIGWDPHPGEDPLDPGLEFRRGDFFNLKDLKLNEREYPSGQVLNSLIRVYEYWIALTDCDGFRIDTVKHVSKEASRNFCGAIHEYAESIGKENFLLLGEVTGGADMAHNYLEIFGRNIDAALDIGEPGKRLAAMVKGFWDPALFFSQYSGHDILGSHRETGRYHVSVLDDHDMVGRDGKHRFAAGNEIAERHAQAAHAVGAQLTTIGIPCIYYGSEQALDGTEARHDPAIEPLTAQGQVPSADRYIREAMFGGEFGAFETRGCHFFDPAHPAYVRIAAIARLRNRVDPIGRALRRGRQYWREVADSLAGPFRLAGAGGVVAWSRILLDQEVLMVLNANGTQSQGRFITVDGSFHQPGDALAFLYRGDWSDAELRTTPNQTTKVKRVEDGRLAVSVDLPPAGMAILA